MCASRVAPLRRRSVRGSRRVYARITLILLFAMGAGATQNSRVARACECTVTVPPGWMLISNPAAAIESLDEPGDVCAFGLRPRTWPPRDVEIGVGDFAIEVHIRTGTLDESAGQAFFERVGDLRKGWNAPDLEPNLQPSDWMVLGRQSSRSPAWQVRTTSWHGIRGESEIGYFGVNGGNHGLGPAQRAIITNRTLTAIFMSDNPYTRVQFDRVLRSFRFPVPPN